MSKEWMPVDPGNTVKLKLVRTARYALSRIFQMEASGQDVSRWRNLFHLLVRILDGLMKGEFPPERLAELDKALDRFAEAGIKVKTFDKTIDNQVHCDTIKLETLQFQYQR